MTDEELLADVPCRREAERLLESARSLRGQLADFITRLEARLIKTMTYASDAEMAFYELWLRNMRELHDETCKQLGHVSDPSKRRMFYTLASQQRTNMSLLGHTFSVDADLLPATPEPDDPRHGALVAWLNERVCHAQGAPHPIIKTKLDFNGLKELCNDLAAHGEPLPPGVVVAPKVTVRVTKRRA